MRKYTQKELKELVRFGMAKDITNYSFEEAQTLYHTHNLEKVGYSHGAYGINGGLLQDENGTMYAITARNSTLAQLM